MDVSADGFSTFVTGFNNLAVNGTSQSVSGLTPGANYSFRVRAISVAGTSGNATLTVVLPTVVPLIQEATHVDVHSFTAHWRLTGVADHSYVDVSSDSTFRVLTLSNLDADTKDSLVVTGLTSASIYYYRVRTCE
jgi:hypothetical protein